MIKADANPNHDRPHRDAVADRSFHESDNAHHPTHDEHDSISSESTIAQERSTESR